LEPEFGTPRYAPEFAGRALAVGREPGPPAPGKQSFVYHSHHREEEWIYVLSGRGVAEIDGEEFEVGAGDFMSFPAPQVAHHLRNLYEEDLVYLMGGEVLDVDVADFPRLGKRMVRRGRDVEIYDASDAKEFGPLEG
jgi:uncharacterized cupin superfamily protein